MGQSASLLMIALEMFIVRSETSFSFLERHCERSEAIGRLQLSLRAKRSNPFRVGTEATY
ncbi:hypothetical protein GCM10028786_06760 [Flaviaesturariibacter terrae]